TAPSNSWAARVSGAGAGSWPGLREVSLFVLEVVLGILAQPRALLFADRTPDLRGDAHDQAPRRHLHPFGQQRAGRHDALIAHLHAVQDDGAHPDQAEAADPTAVQGDGMPDRDVV